MTRTGGIRGCGNEEQGMRERRSTQTLDDAQSRGGAWELCARRVRAMLAPW